MDAVLAEIARKYLDVPTLATRRSDRLDFYDCPVWAIKEALEAAYLAGAADAQAQARRGQGE